MANQQQRPKGNAQAARKRPDSRGAQAARNGAGQRGGQATRKDSSGGGAQALRTTARGASASAKAGARPATAANQALKAAAAWTPQWLRYTALGLSLIGIGLGIYLTVAHLAGAHVLVCSNKGLINCEAVTTSPESMVFGVFPVAELGLAFYVFMALINLPLAWRPEWTWLPKRLTASRPQLQQTLPVLAWRLRLASVIVGIGFILYLVYTELITLRTICLWCTYVHITTFLLFIVLVAQATFWGDPSKARPSATSRPGA